MTFADEEIASQPGCWSRAIALAPAASESLPVPGERVCVLGCGTSLHMSRAYAALREEAGHGWTDAFPASEMPARSYDRVIALSRSGTTTEVLDALRRVPPGTPVTAITAVPSAPITRLATATIAVDFADERSVLQTRFPTTALVLLRTHLGADTSMLPEQAASAVTAPLPSGVADRSQFTFLGRGWTAGIAGEAALKVRESAGAWTEAYPAMEYRHGPISVSGPGSAVWFLGPPDDALAADAERTGALVIRPAGDPLSELIRCQRLAVALTARRGLDPDHPRHLTRSIVLATGDGQRPGPAA